MLRVGHALSSFLPHQVATLTDRECDGRESFRAVASTRCKCSSSKGELFRVQQIVLSGSDTSFVLRTGSRSQLLARFVTVDRVPRLDCGDVFDR